MGWAVPAMLPAATSAWGAAGIGAVTGGLTAGAGQITENLLNGCPWDHNLAAAVVSGAFIGGVVGAAGYGVRKFLQSPTARKLGEWARRRFGNPCAGGQCKIPGVGCFVAGTAVAAITGTVAIETVKVGDLVLAKDPETGITGYYTVTRAFSRTVPTIVELELGADLITTTPEHPFRVQDRGWVPAGELRPGDCVDSAAEECEPVQAIRLLDRLTLVYNFTVAEVHSYFVGEGRWWVHNAPCGGQGPITPPTHREGLKEAMQAAGMKPPAGMPSPQVHHNLPWKFRDWFAQHGLNVNDPQFGRWVSGAPNGPHQSWTPAYNREWERFITSNGNPKITTNDILDFLNQLFK